MNQLGVRLDGVEYVGRVGGVDDGGFDAVLLWQNLVEEPVCGDVCRVGEDRMVAPVEEGGEGGGECGHA